MTDYEHIATDVVDRVAILTMNRPEVLNAMNGKLTGELHDAVMRFSDDDGVGCIVITGAGERAFSAGGDIHEQRENDRTLNAAQLDERKVQYGQRSLDISHCPLPTIGMMNGLAYGGAAVLASSLDMRIGCERTRFRFLAAAYGRINSTWTLTNQVGWPMAKELLFSARIVEAEEAHRIGLVNHLVATDELYDRTLELATQIAANDRPSVIGIKSLLLDEHNVSMRDQWQAEQRYTTDVLRGAKAEDAFPDFIARKGR
ncbi:MAG: enoyl-CoA hydratase/isomerase family protein [Pseudomonadota bacterium]